MKTINLLFNIRCISLAGLLVTAAFSHAQTSLGPNLAISGAGAGADGNGFNNTKTVRDGNLATASQAGGTSNQRISVKWASAQNFNTVVLREVGNKITNWQLINNDSGSVLATGNTIGASLTVNLGAVSMSKINLVVNASAAPAIAEFEVYQASVTASSSSPSSIGVRSSSSSIAVSSSQVEQSSSSIAQSSFSSTNGSSEMTTNYQAENALISNGVVEFNHSGYNGTGFVNYDNVVGSYAEWTVNQSAAGSATLTFRYANGTTANRSMDIRVNGALVNSNLAFLSTSAWNAWVSQSIPVNLTAGVNVIRATANTVNGGPNVDQISVIGSGVAVSSASSSSSSVQISSSSARTSVSSAQNFSSSLQSFSSSLRSSSSSSEFSGETLAFPGAVGFGRLATGGRGGDVYIVTNLNNSGSGSLRDAITSASGPRTIIFAVSGNIMLQSNLQINRPNITIAGQTAPGDGITVAGYPTSVVADNVIIRYMRFRCGDYNIMAANGKSAKGNGDLKGSSADPLDVINARNVIIDHVSTSWAIDETLSVTYSNNVTVQNSIVAESLNDSNHEKGDHGFGSLIRGNGEGGSTFYRNLYAHHDMRNPGAGSNQTTASIKGQLDFVNNVVYGWGTRAGESIDGSRGGVVELNYINNYVIANNNSRNTQAVWDEEKSLGILTFQSGNKLDSNKNGILDGADNGWVMFPSFTSAQKKTVRWDFPAVATISAEQAYELVLNSAGASRARDAIDARIVQQVRTNTGRIIDSQEDVGGLPTLTSTAAPADGDKDGMPDNWEVAQGLNPANASDRNNKTLNAVYTNLEVYLNSLL